MLMFQWKDIPHRSRALTFDDVLVTPAKSDVRSRRDPQLTSQLTRGLRIETPIISANMDTITEAPMAIAMQKMGGFGILHRFMTIEQQVEHVRQVREAGHNNVGASIGTNDDYRARAEAVIAAGANVITVDIAHGHSVSMIETVKWLKDTFGSLEVIAGNIATPEGVVDLIEAGADAIKVGIGPGSMCTTRIITGCGVPQLTAIALCAAAAEPHGVPVIADGGHQNLWRHIQSLRGWCVNRYAWVDVIGHDRNPGEIKNGRKQYRGMASKSAQVSWRGGVPEGMAPEGEATQVSVKGHVKDVISELTGGVRSGMSYVNATTIAEIKDKARFMEMSSNGIHESRAHGINPSGY